VFRIQLEIKGEWKQKVTYRRGRDKKGARRGKETNVIRTDGKRDELRNRARRPQPARFGILERVVGDEMLSDAVYADGDGL
jgi:hypothetical protein